MYNELLHIGPVTVYGYGLMIAIGIIAAYFTAEYRSKKMGLDADKIFGLTIWCVISGYIGSKVLYCITVLDELIANPENILSDLSNGWVVYGGILGGILGAVIYCRVRKMDFIAYFDMAMPSVALAQGFGRIGCFLAGCCYGAQTDFPVAVTFHNSEFAPNNVALIPTQLYSSAFNFANFFVLILIAKRTKRRGLVGGLYLVFYSVGRFVIEFFRGDLERGSVGALSTSQFISLFILAAGLIVIFMGGRRNDPSGEESV
ncbi:MAG: prolipoprotein diacylglyceryl transferase [Eubacterium sp.]|nr:prolipoprotein diacylglyceryl transferase [Eubacterium sp.]